MRKPLARLPDRDLGTLLTTLDVEVLALAECVVGSGFALETGAVSAPCLHYCLEGIGRIVVDNKTRVDLTPHTLTILPANSPFRLENGVETAPLRVVDGRLQKSLNVQRGVVPRFCAGEDPDALILICGFFHATYGSTVEMFGSLSAPIVESFGVADRLDARLKEALAELVNQEVGFNAMSSALLKLVIVALLRRELNPTRERYALLNDANILRALAEMEAQPGASHSIASLARVACLSRSAFMSRFSGHLGRPPMEVLREFRMRQAALQLQAGGSSIDQIARAAGYKSRSSFTRAFMKAYGSDPKNAAK